MPPTFGAPARNGGWSTPTCNVPPNEALAAAVAAAVAVAAVAPAAATFGAAVAAADGAFNYDIPADTRLDQLRSAVVWCRQFTVLFGHAPLAS